MALVDLTLTEDGDISLISRDEGKDISITSRHNVVKQNVMCRLFTQNPDWYTYPRLGANLEDFLGEPNTERVANQIKENIIRALTFDNFIRLSDLDIYPLPINESQIIFYITIDQEAESPISIPVPFSLDEGFMKGE